jgi:hypothetical protein
MASDHLLVPATSVDIERLCNVRRDICHYRRGHLKPESIRKLVMMRTHDRKEMAEEEMDNDEAVSAKPDGAHTRQDLDWAWHTITK